MKIAAVVKIFIRRDMFGPSFCTSDWEDKDVSWICDILKLLDHFVNHKIFNIHFKQFLKSQLGKYGKFT